MNFLNGWKTYIVAAVTVAYAVVHGWQTGSFDQSTIDMILIALGGASIRHGISTRA